MKRNKLLFLTLGILEFSVLNMAQEPGTVLARLSADSLVQMPYENFIQELCEMENPICAYVYDTDSNPFFIVNGGYYPDDIDD